MIANIHAGLSLSLQSKSATLGFDLHATAAVSTLRNEKCQIVQGVEKMLVGVAAVTFTAVRSVAKQGVTKPQMGIVQIKHSIAGSVLVAVLLAKEKCLNSQLVAI